MQGIAYTLNIILNHANKDEGEENEEEGQTYQIVKKEFGKFFAFCQMLLKDDEDKWFQAETKNVIHDAASEALKMPLSDHWILLLHWKGLGELSHANRATTRYAAAALALARIMLESFVAVATALKERTKPEDKGKAAYREVVEMEVKTIQEWRKLLGQLNYPCEKVVRLGVRRGDATPMIQALRKMFQLVSLGHLLEGDLESL